MGAERLFPLCCSREHTCCSGGVTDVQKRGDQHCLELLLDQAWQPQEALTSESHTYMLQVGDTSLALTTFEVLESASGKVRVGLALAPPTLPQKGIPRRTCCTISGTDRADHATR